MTLDWAATLCMELARDCRRGPRMRGEIGPKMTTDDERWRVAARLRCAAEQGQPYTQPTLACFVEADCMDIWTRLADLIEPGDMSHGCRDTVACDREALLALADEMERRAPYALHGGWRDSLRDYARRIREACGVVA